MRMAVFGVFCALLVGVITWVSDADSPQESLNPDPKSSNYNLLVEGFRSGQLNMKMTPPTRFTKLNNPYNPNENFTFLTSLRDISYYNGKFYLYFGVTPTLTLFWPYAELTGHYLSDRCAVAICFGIGFLVMWWLLYDIRGRYFPEISSVFFMPAILVLGVAVGLTLSGSVHDVTVVFGFTFVILALAGIWLALHWPARKNWCLLFASLSYGLAIGSRPSLLFGAIILLAPVFQTWNLADGTVSGRQRALSVLSAIGPILLIGLDLMAYNDLRFDNPFEFGRRYQLTGDYESTTAQQFSLHYLWFNIRYYFLEPMSVNAHFPFLQSVSLPPPPSGYSKYSEYGSILFNYPMIMLVFAMPLVWRNGSLRAVPALSWFILALFLLFVTCALTDCFFLAAQPYYALDFLPPLMLLAFIGFLGLDKAQAHLPNRRRVARLGWYLLLSYSLVFNLFANVKARAASNYSAAAKLLDQHRADDALKYLKNAVSLEPRLALYRDQLALVYAYAGAKLLDQHRADDALKYLKNAVSLEPRPAIYHDQLALAYADSKTHQTEQALRELRTALKIDPNCTKAEYDLGSLLYQSGQSEEAYIYLERALGADATHTNFNYALVNTANAWLLVSNPDPGKRNGPLAMKLAEAACQETAYKDAHTLVVSAAVFGELGRTNEAISLAQKAIVEAEQDGESNALDMAKSLLAKYQKNQSLLPPNQGAIQQ